MWYYTNPTYYRLTNWIVKWLPWNHLGNAGSKRTHNPESRDLYGVCAPALKLLCWSFNPNTTMFGGGTSKELKLNEVIRVEPWHDRICILLGWTLRKPLHCALKIKAIWTHTEKVPTHKTRIEPSPEIELCQILILGFLASQCIVFCYVNYSRLIQSLLITYSTNVYKKTIHIFFFQFH